MDKLFASTTLPRQFEFTEKGQTIILEDINPSWAPQDVMSFYANAHPILTTAKVNAGDFKGEKMVYKFETNLGTKG
jgi:PRTRC genetic system protein C